MGNVERCPWYIIRRKIGEWQNNLKLFSNKRKRENMYLRGSRQH